MPPLSKPRKVVLLLVPALIALLLLASGYWLGVRATHRSYGELLREVEKTETLGRMVEKAQRSGLASVYWDARRAQQEMDRYSWSVSNTWTPFLGTGPSPGRSANAFINPFQMRSSRIPARPKPPGHRRILLTGGSTAFGVGAPSDEATVGGYLEKLLREQADPAFHYEVFTLANPSWASTHERIVIENRFLEWEPDLVISLSGNNDVHWGERGENVLWFRAYQEKQFFYLLSLTHRALGLPLLPDVAPAGSRPVPVLLVAARLAHNVRLAAFSLEAAGVPYLFVLQPNLYVTAKELSEREREHLEEEKVPYFRGCYEAFRIVLGKIGRPHYTFLDLSGCFDGRGSREEVFLDHYHFGDKGNEFMARELLPVVWRLLQAPEGAGTRTGNPSQGRKRK